MSVTIRAIILNYNGALDTIGCLDSLQAQIGVDCRPLVVDNASADDSVARIRAAHSVEVLVAPRNLGFAGGCNLGIRHALQAGCDYLFLVNNDTEMRPDCLLKLLQCAEAHPQAASVAPAIYYYEDRKLPWFTGSDVDWKQGITSHRNAVLPENLEPFALPWCTACAMLISAAHMRAVGEFDERFFCYCEDCDWSFRAQERGYICLMCPAAVLYHKESATLGRENPIRFYYSARNTLLLFAKHSKGTARRRLLTMLTWNVVRRNLDRLKRRKDRRIVFSELRGILDFYRRRFGRCP